MDAPNIKEYILNAVVTDRKFVDHIIEVTPGHSPAECGELVDIDLPETMIRCERSPISELVDRFQIVREFSNVKGNGNST